MQIDIGHENGFIIVNFSYNKEVVDVCRNLDTKYFDWDKKHWRIGLSELKKFITEVEELGHTVVFTASYKNVFCKEYDLNGESYLFDYQKKGVEFLLSRPNTLLGDTMGLGKTCMALVTIKKLIETKQVKKVLIITPLSLLDVWIEENEKFTHLSIKSVRGNKVSRAKQWDGESQVYLTNYETIRNDIVPLEWDLIVLDEASRIKNNFTKLRTKLGELKSTRKIGLSGTPVENTINDLYSIISWLSPGVFPSHRVFKERFMVRVLEEAGGHVFWKILGYKNLDKLKEMIEPIFLRREKSVLKDLPGLFKQTIWCKTNKKETLDLLCCEEEIRRLSKEGQTVLGEIVKMRVVCSFIDSKIEEALEIIKGRSGQVVVFTEFHSGIESLSSQLCSENITFRRLTGKISPEDRKTVLEDFTKEEVKVLICQTKVGGMGLNLQTASTVIFLNRPYTIASEDQAISRLHRQGQKHNVMVYYLLASDSFEQRVNKILEKKKALTDAVIVESVVKR